VIRVVLSPLFGAQLLHFMLHICRPEIWERALLLIDIEGYVYVVPCVPTSEGFFLKTMYLSRQATRRYLHPRRDDLE